MGGDFFDQEKGKDCFRLRKGGEHFQTNFSQNPHYPVKIVWLKIIVMIPAFSQTQAIKIARAGVLYREEKMNQ